MRAHGRGGRGDRDRDRFMGGRGRGGGGGYVGRDKVRFRRGNGSTETPWLTRRRRLATLSSFVSRTADDADRYFPRRFCPRTRADSASPDRQNTADERPDDGHREQAVGAETREPAEHEEGTRGTRNANRKPNVSVSMSKKVLFVRRDKLLAASPGLAFFPPPYSARPPPPKTPGAGGVTARS